jgi:hypothetical protein
MNSSAMKFYRRIFGISYIRKIEAEFRRKNNLNNEAPIMLKDILDRLSPNFI